PCISADFASTDTVVCQKRDMHFTETSTCQAPIASWQWFFGDNTSASYTSQQAFVEHTYAVAGKYNVTMVVATQMVGGIVTDTASRQVVVDRAASAGYGWHDVCLGQITTFENATQSNNTSIKSYAWNFGDPGLMTDTSSSKNPGYYFGHYGQYEVRLVVTNTLGCTDTIVKQVNLYKNPQADFRWSSSCESRPVEFTDGSDSSSAAIVKWNWLFSNAGEVLGASTDAKCSYIFGQAGIYDANLRITDANGCSDTIGKQVAINSSPVAAFNIVENYEDKQGQIMLENGTLNGIHYQWDFGNGEKSTDISPVTTFDKEGHYLIHLTTWNGQNCEDTLTIPYDLLFKGLFVPNAFNPGNIDPEVAVFKPKGINLKTYLIEIYDRWGNLLWTSDKLDNKGTPVEAWDGISHGNTLREGVYLWKITARFRDGEYWDGHNVGSNSGLSQKKTGTVTLIR
ncbi:MAG: PKD domain-containing protein, partial [Bacteroidota bacterium]